MIQRCINVLDEADWETVLYEVGTADDLGNLNNELQLICDATYPMLRVMARNWLETYEYEHSAVTDLVAIAMQAYLVVRDQFTPPDDNNEGILKAFKAWLAKVAVSSWNDLRATDINADMLEYKDECTTSTDEEYYRTELMDCQYRILSEELNSLPANIKDCLLELAGLKNSAQQRVRGLKGETERVVKQYGLSDTQIRKRRERLFKSVRTRASEECE